jgi:hypothetical protein
MPVTGSPATSRPPLGLDPLRGSSKSRSGSRSWFAGFSAVATSPPRSISSSGSRASSLTSIPRWRTVSLNDERQAAGGMRWPRGLGFPARCTKASRQEHPKPRATSYVIAGRSRAGVPRSNPRPRPWPCEPEVGPRREQPARPVSARRDPRTDLGLQAPAGKPAWYCGDVATSNSGCGHSHATYVARAHFGRPAGFRGVVACPVRAGSFT